MEQGVFLPILAQAKTTRSILLIKKEARWKTVDVKGWSHNMSQKPTFELLLIPSNGQLGSALTQTGLSFENPIEEGGGLDLEIHLDELVMVCGSNDVLVVCSNEAGLNRSIAIKSIPGSEPLITKSFKLVPVKQKGSNPLNVIKNFSDRIFSRRR